MRWRFLLSLAVVIQPSASTEVEAFDELKKQDQHANHLEAMASLVATATKTNLRASTQRHLDEINQAIAEPQSTVEDNGNETALSLSIGEDIGRMNRLKTSAENLMSELDAYDLHEVPDIMQSAIVGKVYTKEAILAVERAVWFLTSLNLTSGPEKNKAIEAPDKDLDLEEKLARRLERFFQERERESSSEHTTDDPTMDQEEGEEKSRKQHTRNERKKFKKQHNDHPFHGHEQYKQHASTHYARKMEDLKEAMLNGDVHAAFSAFMPNNHHQAFHSHHNPARARRMLENKSGKLARKEQCELLMECAMEMSMYDLFVYYHSDDIDPGTGEVDKNLVTFNERDIVAMRKRIDEAAAAVKRSQFSEESCDGLLMLFHRTIEWGDIPEWEGASINQVCLAEGTTVFVQFEEMRDALIDHSHLDQWGGVTQASLAKWEAEVKKTDDMMKNTMVVEPFQCAEELFYKGRLKHDPGHHKDEAFPFGGCDVNDVNCAHTLESYQIPTGMIMSTSGGADTGTSTSRGAGTGTGTTNIRYGNIKYEKVDTGSNAKCDKGYEVKTAQECGEAGQRLDGTVQSHGTPYPWKKGSQPDGCFIAKKSKRVYWNGNGKGRKNTAVVNVCIENKKRKQSIKYRKAYEGIKCPLGHEIDNVAECHAAAKVVGGKATLSKMQILGRKEQKSVPCGCYQDPKSKVLKFNPARDGCKNRKNRNINICKNLSRRKLGSRDANGKLQNNHGTAFKTKPANVLWEIAESCIQDELYDVEEKCYEEVTPQSKRAPKNKRVKEKNRSYGKKYWRCMLEKKKEAFSTCAKFEPFQKGLELVFGKSASSGFICGVKDAVVKHDAPLPGSCCLDAPYELDGDAWGHPYDCNSPCKNPGPYLAGLNKKSCDAHGGSWCPTKSSNCIELKNCVEDMKKAANASNSAFFDYLSLMPEIEDPTISKQCGVARQYFGFDEFFINDWQICEDVEQLKHSKDFDFLNEFFKQGGGSKTKKETDEDPEDPDALAMKPPDRAKSSEPKVKFFDQWKSKHQTLANAASKVKQIADEIAAFECPSCMIFGADPCLAVCPPVKNLAHKIFNFVSKALEAIVQVSEFLMKMLVPSEPQAIESQEETKVVHENMQATADYLTNMQKEIAESRRRHLYELPGSTHEEMTHESIFNHMKEIQEEMKQEMLAMKQEMLERDQKMMENMKEMMGVFLTKITEQ